MRESQKKDTGARNVRNVAECCAFPMIFGSAGSKSRLAKAAGAEPPGQMSKENLHTAVAQSAFPSQKAEKMTVSDHFLKLGCQTPTTFPSQNAEKVTVSDQFLNLGCRKKLHATVAGSTFSSQKCTKHYHSQTTFGS